MGSAVIGEDPQYLASEEALAQRIADERRRRGLSQEKLAEEVEKILGGGFPQSAISKIEKPRGRRSITVDEALAFSRVLDIPLLDLMLPASVAANARLRVVLESASRQQWAIASVELRYEQELEGLYGFLKEEPASLSELRRLHDALQATERKQRPTFAPLLFDIFAEDPKRPSRWLRLIRGLLADG